MKKVMVYGTVMAMLVSAAQAYVDQYKEGFEHGIEAVKVVAQKSGIKPKKLQVEKRYTAVVDTRKLTTPQIAYLEYLATMDGLNPVPIRGEKMFFGQYDRLPDAKEVAGKIEKWYGIDAKVIRLDPSKTYMIEPIVSRDVYMNYIKAAQKDGDVILTKYVYVKKPAKKKHSHHRVRYFRLKYPKTQSYKYDYSMSKAPVHSAYFKDYKIVRGKHRYRLARVITTDRGEKFVKVYGRNLFFAIDDVDFR